MLRCFIGFDRRYPALAHVCAYSLLKHSSIPLNIQFLELGHLETVYGFRRVPDDPTKPASTEFAYSRFLVPWLCNYQGKALFLDGTDMLVLADVKELDELDATRLALYCVHHDYNPVETTKMYGAQQAAYPRKNFSSVMLMNCDRLRCWTKHAVENNSGAWLHRFEPIHDRDLGKLDPAWNHLDKYIPGETKLVHATSGLWVHDPERYGSDSWTPIWKQYMEESGAWRRAGMPAFPSSRAA